MKSTYTGKVKETKRNINNEFNKSALVLWICTLFISLIPVGIEMLTYLSVNDKIDNVFWLKCFVEGDLLWTFSTLVLFSVMNYFTRRKLSKFNLLAIIGITIFIIIEAIWFVFRYSVTLKDGVTWPIIVGAICVIVSLIIATPLQIDFIRSEGKR